MRLKLKSASFLIGFVLMFSGCTGQNGALMPADNILEFSTQPVHGSAVPPDILKRAAFTTLRRGYSFFTIASTADVGGAKSGIDVRYGRNPYGFGDPAFENNGLSLGLGIGGGQKRTYWRVIMYGTDTPTKSTPMGARLYNARALTR